MLFISNSYNFSVNANWSLLGFLFKVYILLKTENSTENDGETFSIKLRYKTWQNWLGRRVRRDWLWLGREQVAGEDQGREGQHHHHRQYTPLNRSRVSAATMFLVTCLLPVYGLWTLEIMILWYDIMIFWYSDILIFWYFDILI